MPLDRLVLIIVIVITAASGTIWIGTLVASAMQVPQIGFFTVIPVALILYIGWRVIAERLNNKEDDHYDRIEK
jgi:membrane protein implicated in regulation of membrane protease activity